MCYNKLYLFVKSEKEILEKIRYYVKLGDHIIEVDEFLGANKGLVIAEIEFEKIYNLSVVEIPTARPNLRNDLPDLIYKDELSKWTAIAKECEMKESF